MILCLYTCLFSHIFISQLTLTMYVSSTSFVNSPTLHAFFRCTAIGHTPTDTGTLNTLGQDHGPLRVYCYVFYDLFAYFFDNYTMFGYVVTYSTLQYILCYMQIFSCLHTHVYHLIFLSNAFTMMVYT